MLLAGHALLSARGWVPRRDALATAATLLAVMVGWVLFRAGTIAEAGSMLGVMFGLSAGQGGNLAGVDPLVLLLLGLALGIALLVPEVWDLRIPRSRVAAVTLAALMFICLLRFAAPSPFLYFQF
jgi:alginate O-acetyltransferase complex protein AlgI